jgi:hypothetical protein
MHRSALRDNAFDIAFTIFGGSNHSTWPSRYASPCTSDSLKRIFFCTMDTPIRFYTYHFPAKPASATIAVPIL